MKIRQGFVSNSSSSSFIVGFPRIPKSAEELEKLMFKSSYEIEGYNGKMSTIDIAKRVFDDITNGIAVRMTKNTTYKELNHGSFIGEPKWVHWDRLESEKIRREYGRETGKDVYDDTADPKVVKLYRKVYDKEERLEREKRNIARHAFLEGFWPSVQGKKVFKFEYADDGGESILEHGNIFRAFPHFRISNH
jgi:hypothetical protein